MVHCSDCSLQTHAMFDLSSKYSLLSLNSKYVLFNVQCVHCSQLTLTQVLLPKKKKKKILTQAKLSRFIQIVMYA